MDPDKYQQAWQTQSSQARVTIDADLLLKEVQRNQRDFRALISLLDFVKIGISLLLLTVWIYMGLTMASPWTWYLMVPASFWVIGFILVFRMRHNNKLSEPGSPLLTCVKESLTQVEDQIWLGRNAFWWSVLPTFIPLLAYTAHVTWIKSSDLLDAPGDVNPYILVFFLALLYFLYFINQRAVDWDNEPRRQELLALLVSLGDESTGEHATISRAKSAESSRKLRRWILLAESCLVTLVVIAVATGVFDSNYEGLPRRSGAAGDALASWITKERNERKLVGLAAMVMHDGQVEAAAAYGERKTGSGVSLEIGDRWHLGGISKAITATMIARRIESGQIEWSDTVGEFFPEASVHVDWKPVTLRQLLTDTAGAPRNFPREVLNTRPPYGPESTRARREAVLDVIAQKPDYPPGSRFVYSNLGYAIAGAMVEKATGATWDDLVKREVFEPLTLTASGFGPPQSSDEMLEQPRGHQAVLAGKVAVDDQADNTSIMGPSATIHMSLGDLCTFAEDQLRGELGEGALLRAETYKLLHTAEMRNYAYGWVVKEPTYEIPHKLYWHNGSNTLWYALVVFIPKKNLVVAVAANDGDFEQAQAAAWEIVNLSSNRFDVEGDTELRKFLPSEAFPKRSPFAAVRWQDFQPEVRLDKEWYRLVSLDDLSASEIVDFSRRTYGDKWRMRFEEDLVELLCRMGHTPADTVKLVVGSLTSEEAWVEDAVPMTKENRDAIRNEANLRALTTPEPKPTPAPKNPAQSSRPEKGIADIPHRAPLTGPRD